MYNKDPTKIDNNICLGPLNLFVTKIFEFDSDETNAVLVIPHRLSLLH